VLGDAVELVEWCPDGRLLAAGDLAGSLVILDSTTGDAKVCLPGGAGAITAMAWSPCGNLLAAGTVAGDLVFVDDWSHRTVPVEAPVSALRWSPVGDLLTVGAGWSVLSLNPDGEFVGCVGPLDGGVHAVEWAPGPAPIAAGTGVGIAWCTPGAAAEPVETWTTSGVVRCLATDPHRGRLACGDLGGVLRVFEVASGEELAISGFAHRIARAVWDSDGTHLAIPEDDAVVVWKLEGLTLVDDDPVIVGSHGEVVIDLAFDPAPGSARLASVDVAGRLCVATVGHPGKQEIPLGCPARCLRWQPGQRRVAVGDGDGAVHLVVIG